MWRRVSTLRISEHAQDARAASYSKSQRTMREKLRSTARVAA
jgi:hypothetical protein